MWYLVSLLAPVGPGDTVRITTPYYYQISCLKDLQDKIPERRREFDKQDKIVLWETCVREDRVELAQNSH
jgi:hypothetical protein